MKNLFPIGTVVLLKEMEKRVMIYGRFQREKETGEDYDYAGCFYPEGLQDSSEIMLFNHENIELLFFVGFQDPEEFAYREHVAELFAMETSETANAENQASDEVPSTEPGEDML